MAHRLTLASFCCFFALTACALDTEQFSFTGAGATAGSSAGGNNAGTSGGGSAGVSGSSGVGGSSAQGGSSGTSAAGQSGSSGTMGGSSGSGNAGNSGTGGSAECVEGQPACGGAGNNELFICDHGTLTIAGPYECNPSNNIIGCKNGSLTNLGDTICDENEHILHCENTSITDGGLYGCQAGNVTRCNAVGQAPEIVGATLCAAQDEIVTCVANQPVTGSVGCNGTDAVHCELGQPVTYGAFDCTFDANVIVSCETGAIVNFGPATCSGDAMLQCDPTTNLVGQVGELCPSGTCNPNIGQCKVCIPGDPSICDGQELKQCNDEGVYDLMKVCADGEICDPHTVGGECDVCVAGGYSCSGTILRHCNSSGQDYISGETIDCASTTKPICDATGGQCDACVPNETRCNAAQPERCSADGQTWASEGQPCASAPLCSAQGETVMCLSQACSAGQKRCNGKTHETCNANLNGWDTLDTCNDNEICDDSAGCADATKIFAGSSHTCAIMSDTSITCWGYNNSGQIGNGSANSSGFATISRVINNDGSIFKGATQLALGANFSCALTNTSEVYCWGADDLGQMGDGAGVTNNVLHPTKVASLPASVQIAAATVGKTVCARTNTGLLYCWGQILDGHIGELLDGTAVTGQFSPTQVSGLNNVLNVGVAANHACAVIQSGSVKTNKCWGNGAAGELGNNQIADSATPVTVQVDGSSSTQSGFDELAVGGGVRTINTGGLLGYASTDFVFGRSGASLYRWGDDFYSQMANGSGDTSYDAASPASFAISVNHVYAGANHVCASTTDPFNVYCWGNNFSGQCGVGTIGVHPTTPTNVSGLTVSTIAANQIALGSGHSCAITSVGANRGPIKCWGANGSGQLGNSSGIGGISLQQVIMPTF